MIATNEAILRVSYMSKRIIEVVPHQADWSDAFEQEKTNILSTLNTNNIAAIHHIGSTAVEGLSAKPVIDIMLEIHSLSQLDSESAGMQSLGYLIKGENGIAGRRFFLKGEIHRTHHVHAFITGSPQVYRHLAFRDYLRMFPTIRDEYGAIKKTGAALYSEDAEKYTQHKEDFIRVHLDIAMRQQYPTMVR
ncbi:GrpB family protein [Gynuella sp.]|uniref:GrpB family protein n=1 Tax=Gynuella sp. TaxID=2969146 RepID=UPI003D0F313B